MSEQKLDDVSVVFLPKPNVLKPRFAVIVLNTPVGSKYKINTKLSIDKETGEKIAEPGEQFDLDADIQSYAGSTDIVSIITRLQQGDTSVINVRSDGISGDLVGLPRDINDMVNIPVLNNQAKAGFDKLPDDVKALFDNDPGVFFNAVLENKVDDILANYKPAAEQPVANEGGAE